MRPKSFVLVTGGAGFIGSNLVCNLLKKGYRVRVLDSLVYGKREWIPPDVEFLQADICNLDACHLAVDGIDGIFHLAAMSRSGPAMEQIDVCTQSNIIGTQNILVAAREKKIRKFIYSGSSTYYGNQRVPHHEYETRADLLNFYSLSKYVGEKYTLLFDSLYDVPAIILRYFNVYGPRQPQVGSYALVLGIFLKHWMQKQPLIIHGSGSQRRDFVHVTDVVRANIAAYESEKRGVIYNVGSGTNISIKELANMISPKQSFENRREGDADVTLADITRIKKDLGWEPQISFKEGLQDLMTCHSR